MAPLHSEEVSKRGFTVIVDMRGSKWDSIKPLLKILQESFPGCIHVALIIKPDNFWQKQRTNFGSSKFEFEVTARARRASPSGIGLSTRKTPCNWSGGRGLYVGLPWAT